MIPGLGWKAQVDHCSAKPFCLSAAPFLIGLPVGCSGARWPGQSWYSSPLYNTGKPSSPIIRP